MLQRFLRLFAGICGTLFYLHGAAGPAEARRVALVIGNADYKVGPLANPVNDAVAVAEAFEKQLGFDKVILKRNLGFDSFRAALIEMGRESAGAELSVVYFAGHGAEIGGRNFLIPVDASLSNPRALNVEAIPLDMVQSQLGGVQKLKLVILDACRNSPFPLGTRGNRGLARVEPEDNTVIAYAAKHGTIAADGAGRKHSPFTEALLKHIATPELEISLLFRRIRDDVMNATRDQQQPHVYASLGTELFYLRPRSGAVEPSRPPSSLEPEIANLKKEAEIEKLQAEAKILKAEKELLIAKNDLERQKALLDRERGELEKKRAELELERTALMRDKTRPVTPKQYRVVETGLSGGFLAVRVAPHHDADEITRFRLPAGTGGLTKLWCESNGRWCRLAKDGRELGYVNATYLVEDAAVSPVPQQMGSICQNIDSDSQGWFEAFGFKWNDPLNIRAEPNTNAKIEETIPLGANNVEVGKCSRGWCMVRYRGKCGWAWRQHLRHAETGRAPGENE